MSENDQSPQTERERTLGSLVIVLFLIVLVGGGIWIANIMLDVRTLQDCVASGRRNCASVEVPLREQ